MGKAAAAGAKRDGKKPAKFGESDGRDLIDDAKLSTQPATVTEKALYVAMVKSVTTAFLDVYLKHDSFAQEWLARDARRWIGTNGELERK